MDDATTIPLIGTSERLGEGQMLQATLLGELLATRAALGGLLVQEHRFLGRTAPVAQRPNRDDVFVLAAPNTQSFTDSNCMSGFGALPFLHANVTWSCGSETTTRRVGMEPFLMACGDRVLVYFVQGFAVFATAPWQLMATHLYPDVPSQWRHTLAGTTLTITRID